MVQEENLIKGSPVRINISGLEAGIYCIGLFSNQEFLGYKKIIVLRK
jgi:hypothetical protein